MKKRIGNDITFTWHIFRKSGETQTPESFDGKDVEVKLISPLRQPVTIEDITIATGVVTFTFKGKNQVTLGNYVAILQENRGEDGMVTLDVVDAVTLVPHSYMEEDGDDGDVIEAEAVELESSITAGSGGGFVQQQADWAQTDASAVDHIKNKPNLDVYCRKDADNTHSDGVSDTFAKLVYDEYNPSVLMQADRLTVGGDSIKFYHSHRGEDTKELSLKLDDVEKLKNLPTGEELVEKLEGKANIEDLENYARLNASNEHEQNTFDTYRQLYGGEQEPRRASIGGGGLLLRVGRLQPVWFEYEDVEKIKRTATEELDGLMSAADKKKLDDMESGSTAADVSYDNTKTGLSATNVQDAIDKMADTNLYETVVLTVGSADSSFSPVGQTITVTLEDGSATQYTVPMSRQITFIVQRGMRYTISGTSTEDYRVLPISVKAAIPTRYLTMRYIPIATGVFILQKDGNYYLREEYDAETMAEDAVGVLVLTSALINAGVGIILGKGDNYINKDAINKGYNSDANMKSTTALVGQSNTQNLVTDGDAGAVYVNSLYIEYNDDRQYGYLPSLAEGNIIRANVQEINDAMNLIAGKLIKTDGLYRTSTYIYNNYANRWYYASGSINSVNYTFATRPIYKFHLS